MEGLVVIQGTRAMDGCPYISHILWMHEKGLTLIPSIQATDHPSCGLKHFRICKPPGHPPGRFGIWYRLQVAINGLPTIPYVLWIHWKGFISNKAMRHDFAGYTNHQAIVMEVLEVIWGTSCHGLVASHSMCLLDALERFYKHQSYGPIFFRICKPPSHPKRGVGYDTKYN